MRAPEKYRIPMMMNIQKGTFGIVDEKMMAVADYDGKPLQTRQSKGWEIQ
jgi:hypothetical protein